jgi:DNA-binding NarL/FixJ family response regulator
MSHNAADPAAAATVARPRFNAHADPGRAAPAPAARPAPVPLAATPEPVRRDSLALLEALSAVGCVIRDRDLRLVWCNDAYARLSGRTRAELLGSSMEDFLAKPASDERGAVIRTVFQTGRPQAYYQFGADKRLLCRAFPCDESSFGQPVVLVMVQEAPMGTRLESDERLPVLSTPCLDELSALSPSELRALYHLAKGLSTADIAERLCRATKTVEKHIESIHRKLGTSSRAEIVRLATERGLQAFETDEWEAIIEGSKAVRRGRRDRS